ncbi:hypothetical protein Tco_1351761 [Tanacetum coccineum]
MLFYLTTPNLARFLKEIAPQVEPHREFQPSNAHVVQAMEAWKYSDFLWHNYVLNGLVDSLYNVYCKTNTTKELWESLEHKYKTGGVGTKKFVVAHFLDYKMVDSKNVISQVQDLQLPPSWVEFKNYLKHKRNEMSVKDLVVRLRIQEDDNKLAQKNTYTPNSAKANTVEHASSSLKSNPKEKAKAKGRMTRRANGRLIAVIIEKLPQSWVEFKNYLKHKRKEISVEDLIVRLCIEEEDNKLAYKNTYIPDSAKVNTVEHASSSSKSNPNGKGKGDAVVVNTQGFTTP